jgi:predicted PurR-regulated permease PerM
MKKPAPPAKPPSSADHQHVERMSTWMAILLVILAAVLINQLQWVLLPFVIAGLLAYICTPAIEWFAKRTGLPRALYAVGVFLALLLFASLLAMLGVPSLISGLRNIITDLHGVVTDAVRGAIGSAKVTLMGEAMNAEEIAQAVMVNVRSGLADAGRVATLGAAAFATMIGAILTLVLLFYLLLSGPAIARGLLALVPPGQRPLVRHVALQSDPLVRRYFVGVIIVVVYSSTAAYLGLGVVLGIPHAALLALMTGLFETIPLVGPIAAAVIAGLVALRHANGIGPIIAYAIYATALRVSIDQLLAPVVLGAAARLHPVAVIFCLVTGGTLFGIAGIILAVPAALVVRATLAILYDEPQPAPPAIVTEAPGP